MSQDYELFEGKSLSSLFQDIYDNSKHNKTQLELLVKELTSFIKDGDMAIQLIPMIKEYLEINVKNDDQLVKMAGIVQRLISAEGKGGSDDEFGLSEKEKEQLIAGMEDTIKDIQLESDKIQNSVRIVVNQNCDWIPPKEYLKENVSDTVVKILLGLRPQVRL